MILNLTHIHQMTLPDAKNGFSLKSLIKGPSCFKLHDGALIDLTLANGPENLLESQNFGNCLNECHKQF